MFETAQQLYCFPCLVSCHEPPQCFSSSLFFSPILSRSSTCARCFFLSYAVQVMTAIDMCVCVCVCVQVMKAIDTSKHPPPEPFNHEEIHQFFKEPEITPVSELQEKGLLTWKAPDFEGMRVRVYVLVRAGERQDHACVRLCFSRPRWWYMVAKTTRMPYLYRSFSAKEPYN